MHRRRISWTSIRNFIGTPSLRISSARSVISTSHRADAGGSRASTVTYFVPSVIRAFRDHSRSPCCFESFAGCLYGLRGAFRVGDIRRRRVPVALQEERSPRLSRARSQAGPLSPSLQPVPGIEQYKRARDLASRSLAAWHTIESSAK